MGLNHSPRIVTNGLVLCLDAANVKSYPGSGTTWTDLSLGKYNATLINSPTLSTQNGGYFSFDGTNQYATITSAGPNASSIVTQEAIIFANSLNGTIFGRGRTGCCFNYGMTLLGSRLNFRNTNGDYQVNNISLSTNRWYHFMIITNASGSTGYINGIKQNTIANTTSGNSFNEIFIGRRSVDGGNAATEYFNGRIALIRVYYKEFTESEVQQNFNALRGRYGI